MDRLTQWNGVHSFGTWNTCPPGIEGSREYKTGEKAISCRQSAIFYDKI